MIRLVTIKDLENFIENLLNFKKYKILIFQQEYQISVFLPIKSYYVRKLIEKEIREKYTMIGIVFFILELRWYDGWFNKIKYIKKQ